MQYIYKFITQIPWWITLALVFFGFQLALNKGDISFRARGFINWASNEDWFLGLGKAGIVGGIVAGIVGIIVAVIQIGIFFSWLPETLA